MIITEFPKYNPSVPVLYERFSDEKLECKESFRYCFAGCVIPNILNFI